MAQKLNKSELYSATGWKYLMMMMMTQVCSAYDL
jgi:hypothetical protein